LTIITAKNKDRIDSHRSAGDFGMRQPGTISRQAMGQIVVLDQNMVNMIAAGEVVERPASVVKELMENSIDAGASQITIAVEDGGRRLMSVADNGCGMDGDDLAAAFEPHATSKIKNSADLRSIATLGFRGEALASIASVAQVKAVSRTRGSQSGNCIEIDCGSKGTVGPCSADYGTKVEVRDLFYKLPARRKFLKTANTEMTHIVEQFTRVALAHGDLDMTLTHNGRELYRLAAGQGLRRRISELFSGEIAEGLIETESKARHRPHQQQVSIRILERPIYPRQIHLSRHQGGLPWLPGAEPVPGRVFVYHHRLRRRGCQRSSDQNRGSFL
jgi:DNA mismatch repair protein MutL